jgi:hypothetical protein
MAQSDKKTRGRTSITESVKAKGRNATKPNYEQERRAETTRPVSAGTGKHRGDRRDMNKAYTGNERHSARGNSPRVNVATRKS